MRLADGQENYLAFSGETEHPDIGEVSFVDAGHRAHARRWTHRQSGLSAVRDDTESVLIVAEAVHASAAEDARRLVDALAESLRQAWQADVQRDVLSAASPVFTFGPAPA